MQDISQHYATASVFQFADDVQVVTKTSIFAIVAESSARHWAPAGLTFKLSKDQCWSLSPAPIPDPAWQAKRVERLRCLGPDLAADQAEAPATPIAQTTRLSQLERTSERLLRKLRTRRIFSTS